MNSALAVRIGRPDLAGQPIDPYGGSSGIFQATAGAAGSPAGLRLSGALEGRLTAGVLMLMVLAVGGFYIWTRGVQA